MCGLQNEPSVGLLPGTFQPLGPVPCDGATVYGACIHLITRRRVKRLRATMFCIHCRTEVAAAFLCLVNAFSRMHVSTEAA